MSNAISKAMSICIKAGTKVYPKNNRVVVQHKGKKPFIYDKVLENNKELTKAISLTYIHWANILRD